jgi:hypothetical protein
MLLNQTFDSSVKKPRSVVITVYNFALHIVSHTYEQHNLELYVYLFLRCVPRSHIAENSDHNHLRLVALIHSIPNSNLPTILKNLPNVLT